MAESYLIAHDLGTSGVKAALTDLTGRVIASSECRYGVYYTADGGAEQDAEEWWQAIVTTTRDMMAKANVGQGQVAGMSMDAQMVGTLPVDEQGRPLRRVMIWLDSRAEKEAETLREITQVPFITGKAPSAKVLWIMKHEPEIYARTHKMLDCKDYLHFRMTGNYTTDLTLASATTYFNPWEGGWWKEVLGAMELPEDKLPEVVRSTDVVGHLTEKAAAELGLAAGIPVVSGGGDVPCATVGSGAISLGRTHLYLGTSAWVLANTSEIVAEAPGLAPGVNCDSSTFGLCGEMDNAGGCFKWFAENFIGPDEKAAAQQEGMSVYQYMDQLAAATPVGAEGLLFLPWLWGERAPVDDDGVRGGFANMGLNHKKAHFLRAILEGVGYHTRWIFDEFHKAGVPQAPVNVIGGGATSKFWLQMLADITNHTLRQVEQPLEACARGAAMVAAVGLGYYKDFSEVEKVIRVSGAEFVPNPEHRKVYDQAYANFRSLYQPFSDIGNRRVKAE